MLVAVVSLFVGCGRDEEGCPPAVIEQGAYGPIDAAYFTAGPTDDDGERWLYVASATGGLWVSTVPPGGGGGLTFPLNGQARSEAEVGVDAEAVAVLRQTNADPESGEAQRALSCAAEVG